MTLLRLLVLLVFAALPVRAETPLSAAEFEAFTTGKTLWYEAGGITYGVEEYLPGRRVRWSFLDDECKDGTWYEEAGYICFAYENGLGPQCWQFFRDGDGLRARFRGDSAQSDLYGARQLDREMICTGPRIGV
ncbi:hypothetical protein DXV76_02935 [Rhodobacteraceae bacterium CCMM004]|nr:hypothetical protein DXV76_02935 [Rhodobacteraceae bacterium CCMM004]